jgi:hypothetical protein
MRDPQQASNTGGKPNKTVESDFALLTVNLRVLRQFNIKIVNLAYVRNCSAVGANVEGIPLKNIFQVSQLLIGKLHRMTL